MLCHMRLNAPVQWLEDNIKRHVNKLVIVDAVPAGVPMAFPAPTKSIPFPKIRNFNRGNKVPRATWLVDATFVVTHLECSTHLFLIPW